MEKKEHIQYWLETAEHDLDVADTLFENEKYDYCLFLGHLIIEKTLKSFWIRDNVENVPPKTHNLQKLASQTKIEFNIEHYELLRIVSEFNIEARYPDFKKAFYKKCNKDFASLWFDKIKELYKWLLTQI